MSRSSWSRGSRIPTKCSPCSGRRANQQEEQMIYEVRTYTLRTGAVAEFEDRFAKRKPLREKLSQLAACWTSELGGLNKFVHVWPYKDSNERTRIREESRKGGQWPPQSGVRPVRQENKMLIPAAFSPLR